MALAPNQLPRLSLKLALALGGRTLASWFGIAVWHNCLAYLAAKVSGQSHLPITLPMRIGNPGLESLQIFTKIVFPRPNLLDRLLPVGPV
ncbi:MAG: hypothetical protein BJG00_003085 [Limnothrix sp. CACIAM 69d]|nr:MAG: hypothetical protein BJG00_003085 [Limnothrix sp. CACIAM 69d]